MRIHDIINKEIKIGCKEYKPLPRKAIEITEPLLHTESRRVDLEFEITVFNYLLEQKSILEINKIYKLKSSSADGILELEDGQTVLLEIKYALGWAKCCQARIQFQRFLTEGLYDKLCPNFNKPENGLIVFHHFSGDFARPRKNRECGWVYFYEEGNVLDRSLIKTDIVRLEDNGLLITYPGPNI